MSLSIENQLSAAIEATLAPFLDEDICEYIQSTLAENPNDEDARENVRELLRGSIEEDNGEHSCADVEQILQEFFEKLKIASGEDQTNQQEEESGAAAAVVDAFPNGQPTLRRLKNTVTMKANDIQTFASGLSAESTTGADHEDETISSIQSFYANMIDISGNEAAMSEKRRRKERQKALREEMEEAERKRAIQEAMDILNDEEENDDGNGAGAGENGSGKMSDDFLDAAADNSADVHLKNFDLPNLRGGGADLLQNASLTLARGRRYGLMGRNGCGKTTFLTFIAQRSIEGAVPKKMTMLLVRQEIIGNDLSAVETVLKSDAKREGVKRFIKYCEEELERLEGGGDCGTNNTVDGQEGKINLCDHDDKGVQEQEKGKGGVKGSSKSRQKLAEKRKARLAMAARNKTKNDGTASRIKKENIEMKRSKLSEKLGKAYLKLAEIEEADGGDPEHRARKVLSGMGFSEEMQNKATSQLSGGWRMRVSISCALFANPSLLL